VGTPPTVQSSSTSDQTTEEGGISAETVMKYLTLGYGSAWKIPGISGNTSEGATLSAKGSTENRASLDSTPK
jgi:hypothetical protein